MSKVIGIDLGTGNSCVATIENGNPVIIQNKEGNRTTPSVVQITSDSVLVGNGAKRSSVMKPKSTISSVKRLMGSEYSNTNVQKMVKLSPYEIVNKKNKPYVKIDDKEYSPEQVSSMILGEMKSIAEEYIGGEVKDAVITCPAWFDDVQRNATKTAGELAGLNVLRIINEPTAAILASSLSSDGKDKIVAVVDSGQGTVDVSICEISDGVVEVLSSDGDVYLGGKDYDDALVKYIIDDFKSVNGIDLSTDNMAYSRVIEAAEKAKIELTSSSSTDVTLPYISIKDGNPLNLMMSITRAKFEQLIKPLNDKTVKKALDAIAKAKLTKNDIDTILLVGGTTRIPSLQEALKQNVCENLSSSVNPDEAVAIGAAKQANIIVGGGTDSDVLLLDVTPLSLGIETLGGVMTKLVEANTTIPCKKTQIFSTAEDNQSAVTIKVLQGERPMANDNKTIGLFNLEDIVPAKRGIPQIEVTFDIDSNGIVSVSAKDLGTNKEQKITIENNNLSDEEIEQIKKDAEKFKEEDERKKSEMEEVNSAEQLANSISNSFDELGDKITDDEKTALNSLIDDVKNAIKEKDIEKIKSSRKELETAWQPIITKIYTQQSKEQSSETNDNTQNIDINDLQEMFNTKQ